MGERKSNIDAKTSLDGYGLDSPMLIELANSMRSEMSIEFPPGKLVAADSSMQIATEFSNH